MSIGISLPTSSLPLFPGFPLDCLRIQKPSFLFSGSAPENPTDAWLSRVS